jgi:DNA-binding CsgD family transcriptional regulator
VSADVKPLASDRATRGLSAENWVSKPSPFVGREDELRQLQEAFERAERGEGALVMLVGEPGIGKTAVCQQLCRFALATGGRALVGHCYEEGSFRAPYQPFVEVFETHLRECETDIAELGSGAADLARMVPTLRERLNITPRPAGDPEEDRWRLLQAATDLLRNGAAKQPLVIVLEDLHDADRGTLDLLLYLARNLHGARILAMGTYRDVEVDRAHPLSAALSKLHRAGNVARLQLRGLSTEEVHRLLAETSQQTIPEPFAELVQRQTEGNPLFVHETLRFVIEEGLVERRDGALRRVGDRTLAGRIPEGLRDAVGKRLSRLTDTTNRVLSVAAVVGCEFQLDVLRRVLGASDEELEAALEEALAAAIIEERSVVGATITYHFGHAFFRQTLYDEIVAPRRIRLHQLVARSLEAVHGAALEEHAAELAEHYAFSSDRSDLAKAVHYAVLAARRAADVFAYGDAARQLERALVVLDLADSVDRSKRCDLLLALGEALWPAGETDRVITRVAPDALALAERLGDRSRSFRACRLALDCLYAQGAAVISSQREYLGWAELAHRHTTAGSIERLYADLALTQGGIWSTDRHRRQEARAFQLEALALARQHHDAEAMFRSAFYPLMTPAPRHWAECVRLADEATGWPREGVSGQSLGLVLYFAGGVQLAEGQRARAEALWREVAELAERTHVVSVRLMVPQQEIVLAVVDGHLEDALVQWRRFVERADELGASRRGRMLGLQVLLSPARYLGRAETWLAASDEFVGLGGVHGPVGLAGPGGAGARASCLAEVGRLDEARALVGPRLDEIAGSRGDDELPIADVVRLLQAAVALGHRGAASVLMARLECVAYLSTDVRQLTCVARELGDAAVLVGDRAAARAYYLQALDAAGKIHFRPELALTHLRLAEVQLEEDAAPSTALEHLDLAVPELQDMKMQPALERALDLRRNHAPPSTRGPAGQTSSDTLTTREREVARLLADGLSNREIAERLVISEGTVEVHVRRILSKLDLRSRTQVAGWVLRQGAGTLQTESG